MATLKLRVTGMTCGHCSQVKVEKALMGAGGVYTAVVDLSGGRSGSGFQRRTPRRPISSSRRWRRRGTARRWRASTLPGAGDSAPPVCALPRGSAWQVGRAPTRRPDRCSPRPALVPAFGTGGDGHFAERARVGAPRGALRGRARQSDHHRPSRRRALYAGRGEHRSGRRVGARPTCKRFLAEVHKQWSRVTSSGERTSPPPSRRTPPSPPPR